MGKVVRYVFDERRRNLRDAQSVGWRRVRALGALLDPALCPDELRNTPLRRRLWCARWGLDPSVPLARPLEGRMRAEACWYMAEDFNTFGRPWSRAWEKWACAAAEAGHGEAANLIGEIYRDRARAPRAGRPGGRREAVHWFRLGAARGDATAMLNLGYALFYGEGVRRDRGAAGRCYRAAVAAARPRAEWGDRETPASACSNLGHMYRLGDGVAADHRAAVRWYHRAAASGGVNASYWLWRIYDGREGAPAHPRMAEDWRRRAAKRGFAEAERAGVDAARPRE